MSMISTEQITEHLTEDEAIAEMIDTSFRFGGAIWSWATSSYEPHRRIAKAAFEAGKKEAVEHLKRELDLIRARLEKERQAKEGTP